MTRTIISIANRLGGWAGQRPALVGGRIVVPRGLFSSSLSSLSSTSRHEHYDVVIAGGGAVGSTLARMILDDNDEDGLATTTRDRRRRRRRRTLRVALLELRSAPPSLRDLVEGNEMATTTTANSPGPRAYALSPASLSYLGRGPLRALLKSNRCGVYDTMQIWEHDGPAQLHFTGDDLTRAIEDGRLVDLDKILCDYDGDGEAASGGGGAMGSSITKGGEKRPWLGAVIEDAPLVSSLWDELRDDDRIDLLDGVRIASIRAPSTCDVGNAIPSPPVLLSYARTNEDTTTTTNTTITCDLLVAADGANSQVRTMIGTFPMMTHSYGKKAVTCTVELETDMGRTAFQRFLSHGPIALLPVWNTRDDVDVRGSSKEDGPKYANVVWSTTTSEANHLLSLSSSEFTSILNRHLRQGPSVNPSLLPPDLDRNNAPKTSPFATVAAELDSLLRTANAALTMGTWTESPDRNHFRLPPRSVRVVGPMMGFDLAMSHVVMGSASPERASGGYSSPRVALVGDAAHTMHPMAGQGLNLGMSDVASLSNLIKEAVDSGMDVGGTSLFMDRYNRERMVGGWGIVGGVHGLHEIFSISGNVPTSVANESYDGGRGGAGTLQRLIGYGRSLGMNIVNGVPLARRILAELAAGATRYKV
jgi:ubiquinone biosynthesis monooxygenase Coq6